MAVNEDFALDMLGDQLKAAILAARERTGDDTISAHIAAGVVVVTRAGHPDVDGLAYDDAISTLGSLKTV